MRVLKDTLLDIECVCGFGGCGSTALLICFLVADFTYTENSKNEISYI